MQTQKSYIYKQLVKHRKITRNHCLQRYISRLSARIKDLRDEGMDIVGSYEKTRNGEDFVYRLIN